MKQFSIFGLQSIPEIKVGDDLVNTIHESCKAEGVDLFPNDIIIVTSKIVSKAEGSIIDLSKVCPSRRARAISKLTGKSPTEVEIILNQSAYISASIPIKKLQHTFPEIFANIAVDRAAVERIVEQVPTMLLVETKQGILATDAGLDYSNNPPGWCSLLPVDPNSSAEKIRKGLSSLCGGDVAVIVTDTEIAFTHLYGSMDIAIGSSGIRPVAHLFGAKDRFGREKFGGADVIVDELACVAALIGGQTSEGIPVVILRGLEYEKEDEAKHLSFPVNALSKGIRWTVFSTLKLRFARLIELFV